MLAWNIIVESKIKKKNWLSFSESLVLWVEPKFFSKFENSYYFDWTSFTSFCYDIQTLDFADLSPKNANFKPIKHWYNDLLPTLPKQLNFRLRKTLKKSNTKISLSFDTLSLISIQFLNFSVFLYWKIFEISNLLEKYESPFLFLIWLYALWPLIGTQLPFRVVLEKNCYRQMKASQ